VTPQQHGRILREAGVNVGAWSGSPHADTGRPQLGKLVSVLSDRGFELCGVASLSDRPRDRGPRLGDIDLVPRSSDFGADRSWE
jgi:hypothetical protein